MLMFWLNRASNIVEATPEWLCIPAPTMETFAQVLSNGDVAAADAVRGVFQRGNGALGVAQGHGEAHVLLPSRPVVCRMMSTLMFFWASRLKI